MVNAQPSTPPAERNSQSSPGFSDTNRASNLDQGTRLNDNPQKKKKKCRIVDFVTRADHRVKIKESKKKDLYLDLTRELKKYRICCRR